CSRATRAFRRRNNLRVRFMISLRWLRRKSKRHLAGPGLVLDTNWRTRFVAASALEVTRSLKCSASTRLSESAAQRTTANRWNFAFPEARHECFGYDRSLYFVPFRGLWRCTRPRG